MEHPLILTLKLDAASQEFFDELRRAHFPPERNHLAAHLTLFHHLPGERLPEIRRELEEICAGFSCFELKFPCWRSLGRGVAAVVECPELLRLHAQCARLWEPHLTPQDRQKFQPHITVQNKAEPAEARRLLENLSALPLPMNGCGTGVSLWHYLGPGWRHEADFLFRNP